MPEPATTTTKALLRVLCVFAIQRVFGASSAVSKFHQVRETIFPKGIGREAFLQGHLAPALPVHPPQSMHGAAGAPS